MDIALLLFMMSLTAPLISSKQVLLILNLDIICLSLLGVLLIDLYYAFSIVYTLFNCVVAILGGYSIGKDVGLKVYKYLAVVN